ncbi:MAG: YncE family protein [Chloroflexota bacterium]
MTRYLSIAIALIATVLTSTIPAHSQDYEVWAVDQANVELGGDRLYIWQAPNWTEPKDVVILSEKAAGIGDGPGVRPHLLMFNTAGSHAILANVASGHVYVIRGSDRTVVGSIDVGEQAHGAIASPDDTWILAANQNGKKLARIKADFAAETFTHDAAADLDLKALEDEAHPDNAPICPVMYVGTSKAYVTLRGGGLYVVDTAASPMQVIRSYSKAEVAPAGCGGIVQGDRVWINSGTATSSDLYLFDAKTDDLLWSKSTSEYGTDAHGMLLLDGRYLWMANRGEKDTIIVIDTETRDIIHTITDAGVAPDLMDVNPDGTLVFLTLRGPKPNTGGMPATGVTPGVAVIQVEQGGSMGKTLSFVPIGQQNPDSPADPHGIAVRKIAP